MRSSEILAAAALALALAGASSASAAAERFTMMMSGRSMLPTLPATPAPITVERVTFAELRKGDVVVYRRKHGNTTHRIFRKMSATEWWAKGDNNRFPDNDYVTPANLIGRVVINHGAIEMDALRKSERPPAP